MHDQVPMTQTVSASEARAQWSQLLKSVFRRQSRVIVEKGGIPVAAIISAQDLERFNQLEQQRAERFQALDATRAAFADVPDDELEAEVTRALEQVRAEKRLRLAAPRS
ncbi:MAG: type II toxin-antitoxin system prevent-host-death family antitoxin [Chloroflexota bacterium]